VAVSQSVALAAVSLCSKVKRAANKRSATREDQPTRRPRVCPLPLSSREMLPLSQTPIGWCNRWTRPGESGNNQQRFKANESRKPKIKLTNLNSKSKDVAAFHAKRGHVPGHGRVQFLAFALHLSGTKREKHSVDFCCDVICSVNVIQRTPVADRATVKVKFPDDCNVLHHCRHVDYLLLVPLFILDILFVPGHCSESTFRNFFSSNQTCLGCLSLRKKKVQKKLIQPEQPAPEYGHGHSGRGDTDEREC
jgi:hypothetical protein